MPRTLDYIVHASGHACRGVEIPAGLDRVTVRAHDSVHGYGGAELAVEIPR